jgi:hypothetical protein
MAMRNDRMGLLMLALLCAACGGEAGQPAQAEVRQAETRQERSCAGTRYFSCICPGDRVCPVNDGEYDYDVECDHPTAVTAQNIDNLVGSLRLKDPPCEDQQNCRRVGVHDSSSASSNNPACRCREKIAVCRPKV